jgi:hypothetical protein
MTDQTTSLLAELLDVQKQLLANQARALEQQQLAIQQQFEAGARQRRALRFLIPLIAVVGAAILLPYAWQWVLYLTAR